MFDIDNIGLNYQLLHGVLVTAHCSQFKYSKLGEKEALQVCKQEIMSKQ
jgi:hypothetical protein